MKKIFLSFFLLVFISGCSRISVARGSIVMKVTQDSAHISLGDREVEAGDKVALYRNECSVAPFIRRGLTSPPLCSKRLISKGRIIDVLNKDYSVASFDPGIEIKEGDIVEKELN